MSEAKLDAAACSQVQLGGATWTWIRHEELHVFEAQLALEGMFARMSFEIGGLTGKWMLNLETNFDGFPARCVAEAITLLENDRAQP